MIALKRTYPPLAKPIGGDTLGNGGGCGQSGDIRHLIRDSGLASSLTANSDADYSTIGQEEFKSSLRRFHRG